MEYAEYIFFQIHQNFVPMNFKSGTSDIVEENQVNSMTISATIVCLSSHWSLLLAVFFNQLFLTNLSC